MKVNLLSGKKLQSHCLNNFLVAIHWYVVKRQFDMVDCQGNNFVCKTGTGGASRKPPRDAADRITTHYTKCFWPQQRGPRQVVSLTAECYVVFAQYRFSVCSRRPGAILERDGVPGTEPGTRSGTPGSGPGVVPGSIGCQPEVSKISVFDGFRGVKFCSRSRQPKSLRTFRVWEIPFPRFRNVLCTATVFFCTLKVHACTLKVHFCN